MKNNFLVLLTLAILIFSCSKEEYENQNTNPDNLIFDSELGILVPEHFYEYEQIIVDVLPSAEEMEGKKIKMKSGSLSPTIPGGQIIDGGLRIIGETNGYEEVSLTLKPGWIVTGVGVLIASSSNNYVVLLLERRYLYADGSMSPRYIDWDQERLYKSPGQCEAWCSVPDNALSVGIGIKGRYDVTCLDLYYKYYNSTTNRLQGSNLKIHDGRHSTYDRIWLPSMDYLQEYQTVLTGMGFMSNSSGTAKMSIAYGILR